MPEYINEILTHADLFMGGLVTMCVLGGAIIQFSPLPIEPITWLGNILNQDLKRDINKLDQRLGSIEEDALKRDLQAKSSIVLSFADKLRRTPNDRWSDLFSLEDFKHVIDVMDEYDELIEKNHLKNGRFEIARKNIIDAFNYLYKQGAFVEDYR